MNRKKVLTLILTLGVVAVISFVVINYATSTQVEENIKVSSYIPPTIAGKSGYQIDKYENVGNNQWLNESEVLSLTKKDGFNNTDQTRGLMYCSIYNLNTKESKDFKNVNIDEFLGVSPDKKYVLYAEPRVIPEVGSDEWEKANESGDLLHKNVKLLNLVTGEITDLNTKKVNCSAEFKWVGNNKILVNYYINWTIIDTNGKEYASGNYSGKVHENPNIVGVDDIKDLGDSLEGKFYYAQDVNGENGGRISTKLCYIDIKTKEIKTLRTSKNSTRGSKKGKTIVMDNFNDNGEAVNGIFENRTFGEIIMDESGNLIRNIDLPKGVQNSDYILSPDGSKAAYLEYSDEVKPINSYEKSNDKAEVYLKVIDIKTGDVKEIVKSSSLKDENEVVEYNTMTVVDKEGNKKEKKIPIRKGIENICWSSTGKELSFTYGNSFMGNGRINTFVISFDR